MSIDFLRRDLKDARFYLTVAREALDSLESELNNIDDGINDTENEITALEEED